MGKLDTTCYRVFCFEGGIMVALCLNVLAASWEPLYLPTWIVMIVLFFTAFVCSAIFGFLSLSVFYDAWQAKKTELKKGGAADVLAVQAVQTQFVSAAGAMVTGSFFFFAMGLEQLLVLSSRWTGEPRSQDAAMVSMFVLYIAVFVDSICNDFCSHTMMFTERCL